MEDQYYKCSSCSNTEKLPSQALCQPCFTEKYGHILKEFEEGEKKIKVQWEKLEESHKKQMKVYKLKAWREPALYLLLITPLLIFVNYEISLKAELWCCAFFVMGSAWDNFADWVLSKL